VWGGSLGLLWAAMRINNCVTLEKDVG
jgi:hypothetical protein